MISRHFPLPVLLLLFSAAIAPASDRQWTEITAVSGTEPGILSIGDDAPATPRLWAGEAGRYIVCHGGSAVPVQCAVGFLDRGDPLAAPVEDGRAVTGRIQVGEEPARGAAVAVFPAKLEARRPFVIPLILQGDRELVRELRADAEGRFRTPPLAPGQYQLELTTAGGRRQLSDPFTIAPPKEREGPPEGGKQPILDLGDFRLPTGLTMKVNVVTPDGLPIPEAKLTASQGADPRDQTSFFATTDADGLGIVRNVGADAPIKVRCEAEGYVPYQERFPVPPDAMLCVLEPLARIRGRVLAEGEPMPQATIATWLPPPFAGAARRKRTAATDEEGAFEILDLSPRPYVLTVAAPGYRAETFEVEVAAGDDFLLEDVELIPAEDRLLRVLVAESQEALPDAVIVPVEPSGLVQGMTDENGEAVLALGEGDPVTLRITAAGFPPAIFELPATPPATGEADEFVLYRGGSIRIQAWAETGEPCAGCDVAFFRSGGDPLGPPPEGLKTDGVGVAKTEILPKGTYHVTLESASSTGRAVTVHSGQHSATAEVRSGEVTPVQLGEPARTVSVEFWPPPPPGWRLQATTARGARIYESEPDGRYTVRQRPQEPLTLRLIHEGVSVTQAILPPDFDDPDLRIDLPGGEVRGQIESGEARLDVRLLSVTNPAFTAWAASAPGGHFQISFLLPGTYVLEVLGHAVSTVSVAPGDSLDLGVVARP